MFVSLFSYKQLLLLFAFLAYSINKDIIIFIHAQISSNFIELSARFCFTGNIEIIKQLVYTSQTKDEFMDNFKGKIKLFLISLSNCEKYASSY